jgi:glutamate dehydrogenase
MGEGHLSKEQLKAAMLQESQEFEQYYNWLEEHMSPGFFEEVEGGQLMVIVHRLMGFALAGLHARIEMQGCAIIMCKDEDDADIRVLREYQLCGIKNYVTFTSDEPPQIKGMQDKLRICLIYFTEQKKDGEQSESELDWDEIKELYAEVVERNHDLTFEDFTKYFQMMNSRFIRSMTRDRLIIALDMFCRAKSRDHCQYEAMQNKQWRDGEKPVPSLQIVLAWRNTPKYRFLYRLAKLIHRHNLLMSRVNMTYVTPYAKNNILMLSLGLNGANGKAAWETADINDFLREMVTLKYFDDQDRIEDTFVNKGILSGNLANYLRTSLSFCHQALVHADPYLYSHENVEEAFCRHPTITKEICHAFEAKFHPEKGNLEAYETVAVEVKKLIDQLDTGHEINDIRRKNVLTQAINFVQFTLKTNVFRNNKSSFGFRLDPKYLTELPFDRKAKFPEIPYGIFFFQGMHFIGFHIRFKDLARGGLRTIMPRELEALEIDRNTIFSECYNLSYTQQKKNKDIPEGGAKGVILLEPYGRLDFESQIYTKELKASGYSDEELEHTISKYREEKKGNYLYCAQRSYIHTLLNLVNAKESGVLKAKNIIDYYRKPEYIYLGPDENMHNSMLEWIANYSEEAGYKLGSAFMSSKPNAGINHKQYGITSLGVNVCMEETLFYLDIDPYSDPFTIKMTGGPDGDVAGNQILNLYTHYPDTAKLVALIDGSGTIRDKEGLDLKILSDLFKEGQPIRFYPPEKLHDGGFLLDNQTKKQESSLKQQTLLYKKENGAIVEEWISGNEANHLLRHNVHEVEADMFIPAGGRPRTLNQSNYEDYLNGKGRPTSKAIVEGANLYLSPEARHALEDRGVVIIKDSSANKGGVICSSLEVLCNLVMGDEKFIEKKDDLMPEILNIIRERAREEATVLLQAHCETEESLIELSDAVSKKINRFTYEILTFLEPLPLSDDTANPLIRTLLNYCPPLIRHEFEKELLANVPDIHKKAMIACFVGSKMVYTRGLEWWPSIADILPLIVDDPCILDPTLEP